MTNHHGLARHGIPYSLPRDEKDGEDKEIKNEEKATNKQQKSKKS